MFLYLLLPMIKRFWLYILFSSVFETLHVPILNRGLFLRHKTYRSNRTDILTSIVFLCLVNLNEIYLFKQCFKWIVNMVKSTKKASKLSICLTTIYFWLCNKIKTCIEMHLKCTHSRSHKSLALYKVVSF